MFRSVKIEVRIKMANHQAWENIKPQPFEVPISTLENEADTIIKLIRSWEEIYARGDNRPILEIRWNYKDSFQGHYLNPVRYKGLADGDRCAVINNETGKVDHYSWVIYRTNMGKYATPNPTPHCYPYLFSDTPVDGLYAGTGTAKAYSIRALTAEELMK